MMKRISLSLIILLCLSAVWAQEINSFRYLGSGGALNGDLEYALDPIDLKYLNGIHLFSGLSNFSANDRIFANQGENYLLLGAATDRTPIRGLKSALLFRYQDMEIPQLIRYATDPAATNYEYANGNVETTHTLFSDMNNNGLYDMKEILYQKYRNVDKYSGLDGRLVLSYPLGKNNFLGYKAGILQASFQSSSSLGLLPSTAAGSPTAEYHLQRESLPEMDPTVNAFKSSDHIKTVFANDYDINQIQNQIAYMKEMKYWDLAAYYNLDIIRVEDDINERFDHKKEREDIDFYDIHRLSFIGKNKSDGFVNQLYLNARYKLKYNALHQYSGYWDLGLGGKYFLRNGEKTEDECDIRDSLPVNSNGYFSQESKNYEHKADGTGYGLFGNIRLNYPLNKTLFWGSGIFCDFDSFKDAGNYKQSYVKTDSTFFVSGGWYRTVLKKGRQAGDIDIKITEMRLKVPVGLEYWFTNNMKWALRVGSCFRRNMSVEKRAYSPTLIEPEVEHSIDFFGVEFVNISDNAYSMESFSEKKVENHSDFSYGISFKPSKNLQIELINMFEDTAADLWNTSFIKSLRLSFSLTFD